MGTRDVNKNAEWPLYRQSLHNKIIHKWPLSVRILSCELERLYITKMKNGFWNGGGSFGRRSLASSRGDTKGPPDLHVHDLWAARHAVTSIWKFLVTHR